MNALQIMSAEAFDADYGEDGSSESDSNENDSWLLPYTSSVEM